MKLLSLDYYKQEKHPGTSNMCLLILPIQWDKYENLTKWSFTKFEAKCSVLVGTTTLEEVKSCYYIALEKRIAEYKVKEK